MMILPPSDEQEHIISNISHSNIIVNAVAGSGKTTTALHIAMRYPELRILLLTYNARLKSETRARISSMGLTNIIAHNYHAFCRAFYVDSCINETQMKQALDTKEPKKTFAYDLIICDESQDITPIFYKVINKIANDNAIDDKCDVRLLFVGDVRQSLYEYQSSDSRFLTEADKAFAHLSRHPFMRCELKTSYRVSPEIADFINSCVLFDKEAEIVSGRPKTGIKPQYHIYEWNIAPMYAELLRILRNGYKPEDIFVLGQSVVSRSKDSPSPICKFENMVKTNAETKHIPVYAPSNDDEVIADNIMNGKLVFSTFHQAKGLERKVVFIIGFDESQFRFYIKDERRDVCPNTIYVGMTRASHELIMFHNNSMPFYQFINQEALKKKAKVHARRMKIVPEKEYIMKDMSVSQLLKHQSEDTLAQCRALLQCETIRAKSEHINIPSVVKTNEKELYEPVSDITGLMIPLAYEIHSRGKCDIIQEHLHHLDKGDIALNELSTADLAFLTTYALTEGNYIFKRTQITDFGWVSEDALEECLARLSSLELDSAGTYEKKCQYGGQSTQSCNDKCGKLRGRMDFISKDALYEFKCVGELTDVNYIQLSLYMLMMKESVGDIATFNADGIEYSGVITRMTHKTATIQCEKKKNNPKNNSKISYEKHRVEHGKYVGNKKDCYLYNVLSDELVRVECPQDSLLKIYETLLKKYDIKIGRGEFLPLAFL